MHQHRFRSPARASALGALLLLGAWATAAALGSSYQTERQVVAGAGQSSASGNHQLGGTLGQPSPGRMGSGSYTLELGFWTTRSADATAVGDGPPAAIQRYRLHQNHPNPFNPTTTIRFALPAAGRTRLSLYDPRGRHVRTVLDRDLEAGEHELVLDARGLASGVYWYRLESGSFTATRRMALVE